MEERCTGQSEFPWTPSSVVHSSRVQNGWLWRTENEQDALFGLSTAIEKTWSKDENCNVCRKTKGRRTSLSNPTTAAPD